jgi:putative Holliday junction resolvase
MGIDFGERRIGVALSDPTGTLASPRETLERRAGKRVPLAALEAIARAEGVERLVVGLPLDSRGEENDWCRAVREAGDELARRLSLPVDYVDERFSSAAANRTLRGAGMSKSAREDKALVDRAAAALILQRWLDAQSRASEVG